MSDSQKVKALIKEAEIYRKQGLVRQSRDKYSDLLRFVEGNERLSSDQKFMDALRKKLDRVEKDLEDIESAPDVKEVSGEVQELISRLFTFSQNKDAAAVEGAVALAKFGQYDRAVAEFQRLIMQGILPRAAATNLLSCHLTLGTPEAAVSQFEQWVSVKALSRPDLEYLRGYLQGALQKKGLSIELSALPPETPSEKAETEVKEEDVIEISSVCVTVPAGPRKGKTVELDVTFQSGNAVSIIIPAGEREMADGFKEGMRLPDLQCYSVMGVFNGTGTVKGKSVISSGPKRGDFTLDIVIDSA
ncbi:MAG: hypothetical protein JXL84_06785 [Deltaproteobacteria bacterium]|nr:hypothetical protein [Deltaproteobacteria bacterium]